MINCARTPTQSPFIPDRRKTLPLAVLCAAMLLPGAPTASADSTAPLLEVQCAVSHTSHDDPIVHFGKQGAAHEHVFLGNTTTRFDSTDASLRAAPQPGTTCDNHADRAAYWFPMLYENGKKLLPGNFGEDPKTGKNPIYFNNGQIDRTKIKPIPAGLRMLVDIDDPPAHLGQLNGWRCGDSKPTVNIPNCTNIDANGRNRLEFRLAFPQCVKLDSSGKPVLDSADHRSHVAYTTQSNVCPSTHPYPMPRIVQAFRFPSNGGSDVTLSSGAASTLHADFFNTWDQTKQAELVNLCINQSGYADAPPCRDRNTIVANPNYPNPAPVSSTTTAPVPAPMPAPTPAPSTSCSTATLFQGTLADREGHSIDYTTTTSGQHLGCLTGPSSANFDLYLKRLDASGAWTTVARSVSSGSTENVSYTGAAGTFRWRVLSASGSGSYSCKIARPT